MPDATSQPSSGGNYTIQGRVVTLPAIVRDAGAGNAIFLVSTAAAQKLVGEAFEVLETTPGQTQLILGFVDYRDNDLGDYNEAMIVFMVRPKARPDQPDGTFIYKLPVNQSFTCEAGVKIWGFPKTVEQVEVTYAARHARCRLLMGGEHVFTLTVPRGAEAAGDAPDLELVTYTYHNGPTLVPFATGGSGASVGIGPEGVELELGTHPIAGELRSLGLPAPALMSTWTEHMRGTFGAPQPV